ncbi:hypothetical protein P3T73_13190 [Kiritimatiellota bacterium B12222]|nr:hypothetical protein P3T73_13190 [Kiritimatiellota bacterium B12222]
MRSWITPFLISICLLSSLHADDAIAAGRTQSQGHYYEVYGGIGNLSSLSGRVQETAGGSLISGGLDTNLQDLGIDEGSGSYMFGGKITGKWFTWLIDYRQNTIEASGTADTELNLSVDGLSYNGQSLDYLLIPVDSEYSIQSDTNMLGIGARFTPFTINPKGKVRFTPWAYLGIQYVDSTFEVDSGNTVNVKVGDFNQRVIAVNGRASGDTQLIIPEYGLGGEVRFLFHEEAEKGPELLLYGTYKILSISGDLDTLGIEDDEFQRLDLSYTAVDAGITLYWPMSETLDLMLGLNMEQVETNTVLDSAPSAGNFQRDVDLNYTLYGLRAGLRF